MPTKAAIYQTLYNWLTAESGLTVIRANQKGPRPARPYASLNFLNPSNRLGNSIDQQRATDAGLVAAEGMRSAVASINIFGDNALDTMAAVRDSLDRADVQEVFEDGEIAHLDEGPITDLTELQETIYEERAQMDLTLSFVASSEVDVGTIEEVVLEGEADGHEITQTVTIP